MEKNMLRGQIMQKGFSFTFDGVIALFVIIIAIVYVAASSSNPIGFSSQKIVQKQIADDALQTAIDLNTFNGNDTNKINAIIQSTIPLNYDYQVILSQYTASGAFPLVASNLYGNVSADFSTIDYVEAKKVYPAFSGTDMNNVYVAKLRVWVR